jgi:hypothetical protein
MKLMISIFVFIIVFTLCPTSSSLTPQYRVGVCVTGLQSRFQPETLITNLIKPNPNFMFYLFLTLQVMDEFHFSTAMDNHTIASPYSSYSNQSLKLLFQIHNVHLVHIEQPRIFDQNQYKQLYNNISISIFTQKLYNFNRNKPKIFSMLVNQMICAKSVSSFMKSSESNLVAFILTREDTYIYNLINFTKLYNKLNSGCDLISRNVLAWGGISTRFIVANPQFGIAMYGSRTKFIQEMTYNNQRARNAETFETMHAHWTATNLINVTIIGNVVIAKKARLCTLPLSDIPVVVSQYQGPDMVCHPPLELHHEMPPFIRKNVCRDLLKLPND